jgi:hypothetical protein
MQRPLTFCVVLLIACLGFGRPTRSTDRPASEPVRKGPVRLLNRALADDQGVFNALGASLFWALWGEKHDPDRLDANLKHLAEHDVDYVRILGMVGGPSWKDRRIDPRAADYWETVDRLFARLAKHGLRAQVTLFADAQVMMTDRVDRLRFVDAWAQRSSERILAFEVVNEGWQNGFEDVAHLREVGRRLADQTSLPVALSSMPHDPPSSWCDAYANSGADFVTIHYDRDTSRADGIWRPVRQPWGFPMAHFGACSGGPPAATNNEPIGPQSSVAEDADPLRLALSYATTFVAGNAAYVYHSGAGIRGGGTADLALGRKANIGEYDERILDALSAMRRLLPPGLANWTRHDSDSESVPWNGFQTAIKDRTLMSAYAATSGDRVVLVLLNQREPITLTARQSYRMTRYDGLSGAVLAEDDVPKGSKWIVPPTTAGSVFMGTAR